MARQVTDESELDDAAYLRARYGTIPDGVRRRRLLVVGVLIGAAVVAWSIWIGVTDDERVRADTIGFDLRDGDGASVTFDVTMKPGQEAICTLRALNERSVEVGRVDVRVPASTRDTQRVRGHMPTIEPATTAMVKECALRSSDD